MYRSCFRRSIWIPSISLSGRRLHIWQIVVTCCPVVAHVCPFCRCLRMPHINIMPPRMRRKMAAWLTHGQTLDLPQVKRFQARMYMVSVPQRRADVNNQQFHPVPKFLEAEEKGVGTCCNHCAQGCPEKKLHIRGPRSRGRPPAWSGVAWPKDRPYMLPHTVPYCFVFGEANLPGQLMKFDKLRKLESFLSWRHIPHRWCEVLQVGWAEAHDDADGRAVQRIFR